MKECSVDDKAENDTHSRLTEPRGGHNDVDETGDARNPNEKECRAIVDLKLQVAEQSEALDLLSSKLRQAKVERDVSRVEKAALSDELVLARKIIQEYTAATSAPRRFALPGFGAGEKRHGGSLLLLLEKNAALSEENSRLKIEGGGLQQSFQSRIQFNRRYIELSQKSSREDKDTIERVRKENEVLRRKLSAANNHPPLSSECTSMTMAAAPPIEKHRPYLPRPPSEDTAATSQASHLSENEDVTIKRIQSQLSVMNQDYAKVIVSNVILTRSGTSFASVGGWTIDGVDIEEEDEVEDESAGDLLVRW